jgi:hypothetical protein
VGGVALENIGGGGNGGREPGGKNGGGAPGGKPMPGGGKPGGIAKPGGTGLFNDQLRNTTKGK